MNNVRLEGSYFPQNLGAEAKGDWKSGVQREAKAANKDDKETVTEMPAELDC